MGYGPDQETLQRRALREFYVRNWPERLQRASRAERDLVRLMTHPWYRLSVRTDAEGVERLYVTPTHGMGSPLTDAARDHIRRHRSDLLAWVRRVEADRARLRAAGLLRDRSAQETDNR